MNPKFKLGQLVSTPAALHALERVGRAPLEFVRRHLAGDWGDVDAHDAAANERALKDGSRIFSSYKFSGIKIWIITEAEGEDGTRASTCVLLPEDY